MYQINIPLFCPNCDGTMYAVRYDSQLKILKERGWQVCRQCGFERTIEDFKNELLTV